MECFKIYADEIKGRLDPYFYRSEFKELEVRLKNINIISFGEIIESIVNGFDYRDFSDDGLIYLRVSNIKPFGLGLTGVKKINLKYNDIAKNIKLKKGNILLTRKGTFGVALSVKKDSDFIISSEIFRIILKPNISSKYVELILNSSICQKQFDKYKIGAIMGSLSQEAVKKIKIPLPPFETQNRVVELMDNVYNLKKQKETEAYQLLDSINDYVLDELGIKLPELKDKMSYVVYADDVKEKRADAYYHQPKFEEVEKAIKNGGYELIKINQLFNIVKDNFRFIDLKENEEKKFIEIRSIDNQTGMILKDKVRIISLNNRINNARKTIKKNDILISTRRPYLKSISFITQDYDNQIATTFFTIIRKKREDINEFFVYVLLRNDLFINIFCRNLTITTYPVINDSNIANLKIPLPPISVQNKIADEVKRRMQRAKQLQEEAKKVSEEAKLNVERIILEEEKI